jgi:hypothetical protein
VRSLFLAPIVLLLAASSAAPQFTPFPSQSGAILEGNWQSCRGEDGRYAERVYDHVVGGVGTFELHMGPRREFALFAGVQEEHRDHKSVENLLQPYTVPLENSRAQHHWDVPSLNVSLTVTLAGGSRTDCESWFIVLQPLPKTSH